MSFLKRLFGGAKKSSPPQQTTTKAQAPSLAQPASPPPPVKDEDSSFEALVEELVALSQTGFHWGLQNRFPAVEEYPQYPRIRKLGELIHAKAGYKGMQDACRVLQRRVVTRDGGGQAFLAEYGWRDIGGWRP